MWIFFSDQSLNFAYKYCTKNMKKLFNRKRYIVSTFSFAISMVCLAFVVWQSSHCIIKYLEKPQGTKLSLQTTAQLPFPAITVCNFDPNYQYNSTILEKQCGIRCEILTLFFLEWKMHYVRFSWLYWHFCKSIIFAILYPKGTPN